MRKTLALLIALTVAVGLQGCTWLEKLGLKAEAKVVCDEDGCRVEGHVHSK